MEDAALFTSGNSKGLLTNGDLKLGDNNLRPQHFWRAGRAVMHSICNGGEHRRAERSGKAGH